MDSPIVIPQTHTSSPTSFGRRRTSLDANSPEFEFWMVRNPSFPQPNLLSADELFVDGVLLPLHLRTHSTNDPNQEPDPDKPEPPPPDPGPKITSSSSSSAAVDASTPSPSASKRWRDIFKKGEKEKKNAKIEQEDKEKEREKDKDKDKEKKRERKSGGGGGTSSSAELNINIWPFSRSRSAGNACTRPKHFFGAPGPTRKVNSAPCSRSNSAGESKSRKWPSSPGRPGVHLGRSSPVWQVRRGGGGGSRSFEPTVRNAEKGVKKEAQESRRSKPTGTAASGGGPAKAKVLNLNVPMCIGYRNQLSCRSDENSALGIGNSDGGDGKSRSGSGGGGGRGVGVGSGGNLFNLRNLFTKKVY